MEPQGTAFFVGSRPQVIWAWDLEDRNLTFLRGIDAGYFTHIANSQAELLGGESRHFAAAALRVAYGQALETLFAVAAAAPQAPHCAVGWMLSYRNQELVDVVRCTANGRPAVPRDPSVADPSLDALATSVMNATQWEQGKRDRLARGFARMWRRWASEFLDERATGEYNSFKHGMRASLGGFTLAIGLEEEPGVPAPQDAMRAVGGSTFGSTFYYGEQLGRRLHQFPRRTMRNWSPTGMANGLTLLAMSIQNIVSYLRIVGGDQPGTCRFESPVDPDAFDEPWKESIGVTYASMDVVVREDQIQPLTRDEVISLLTHTGSGDG